MAAMTTALTVFSDNGNSRTYTYTGHTAKDPKLVIQKRRVPAGAQVMQEDSIRVLVACQDSGGLTLTERVSFEAVVRRPITRADDADVTPALAVFRDIVASDEFTAMVNTQNFVKA